jgi:hypothetical protein
MNSSQDNFALKDERSDTASMSQEYRKLVSSKMALIIIQKTPMGNLVHRSPLRVRL